ncbi:MAG: hypothetical protein Q9191_005375 [Dirinaria sp. TL-2023a]
MLEHNLFQWNQAFAQIENGTNFAKGYTIAPISALQTNQPEQQDIQSATQSQTSTSSLSAATSRLSSTAKPEGVTATSTPSVVAGSSNNDEVVRVGAGVGVGIGVPLLLGLGAFLMLWLRERRINQHLRKDLDASRHPYYPIIPSAWQRNGELGGEDSGKRFAPTEANVHYARGQQELEDPVRLPQLPVGGQDVNQELSSKQLQDNVSTSTAYHSR